MTDTLALKLQREPDEVRAGLRPVPPPRSRRRRNADPMEAAPAVTVPALIVEFRGYLLGGEQTEGHVEEVVSRVAKVFTGMTCLAEITADRVERCSWAG